MGYDETDDLRRDILREREESLEWWQEPAVIRYELHVHPGERSHAHEHNCPGHHGRLPERFLAGYRRSMVPVQGIEEEL